MGKVDKICQLYLQPLVKTFSLSRIGRTVVKIRQTRLTLCCAARDESERELRIISSVSYSFFFFFFSIIESPGTCYHPQVKIWLNSFRGVGEVPLTLLPSPCLFSDNSLLSVSHKNLIIQIYAITRNLYMHGVNFSRPQIIPFKGLPFSTKPTIREKRATV